jgi:hypothetical protein
VHAEEREHGATDRVRGRAAVGEEVVEGRERAELGVIAKGHEEIAQRLDRKRALADGLAERDEDRMGRGAALALFEAPLPQRERVELRGDGQLAVGEIVRQARVRVHGGEVSTALPRQEQRADEKVLGMRAGEPHAVAKGELAVGGRGQGHGAQLRSASRRSNCPSAISGK